MGGEEAVTAVATDRRIRAVVAGEVGSRTPEDHVGDPGGVSGAIENITTAGLATHPAEWESRVITFFDRALLHERPGKPIWPTWALLIGTGGVVTWPTA